MIKLNKSTTYALHAALEMAIRPEHPVTAAFVSERHALPENVVAKALQQLVRAGYATGTRGVGGGYRLTRDPDEVSIQDLIDVFESDLPPVLGSTPVESAVNDPAADRLTSLFAEVDETVRSTFSSVSLGTLTGSSSA